MPAALGELALDVDCPSVVGGRDRDRLECLQPAHHRFMVVCAPSAEPEFEDYWGAKNNSARGGERAERGTDHGF